MTDGELSNLDEQIAAIPVSHGAFVLPLLRVLHEHGGSATTKEATEGTLSALEPYLSPAQVQYLRENNRIGWVRMSLKRVGFIGPSVRGVWTLAPIGKEYAAARRDAPWEIPDDIPTNAEQGKLVEGTELVRATAHQGFDVPVLATLADGVTAKKEAFERIEKQYGDQMIAGDHRTMQRGNTVWRYRASWALTKLGQEGAVANVGLGAWRLTDAGKKRLEEEQPTWRMAEYQDSKARVRIEGPPLTQAGDDGPQQPAPPPEAPVGWNGLKSRVAGSVFRALSDRLRPALGPTPDLPGSQIARNAILYGPPGTGKTHVAKLIAQALTGHAGDDEERRWRIVQFHPSYTYEDFVQGLKPDLTQTELRYQLERGPFFRIADRAAQEPDQFFVLIIDEINRGDPARIFGELLYALEYREETVDLPLGGELSVPANLVVIGTMNSVDRSVALVDYALRRRFGFIRLEPDPSVIDGVVQNSAFAEICAAVLTRFNDWIRRRLDREHTLGHSYFLNPSETSDPKAALSKIWSLHVRPLMEEYFFGEEDGLREAETEWDGAVSQAIADALEVSETADDEAPPDPAPG